MNIVFKLKKEPPEKFKNMGFLHVKGDYYVYALFTPEIPLIEKIKKFIIRRESWINSYMNTLQTFLNKNLEDVIIQGVNNSIGKGIVSTILHLMGVGKTPTAYNSKIYYYYLVNYSVLFQREFPSRVHLITDGTFLTPVNIEYYAFTHNKYISMMSMKTTNPHSNGWQSYPTKEHIKTKPQVKHTYYEGIKLYIYKPEIIGEFISYTGVYYLKSVTLLYPLIESIVLVKHDKHANHTEAITGIKNILKSLPTNYKCNDISLKTSYRYHKMVEINVGSKELCEYLKNSARNE